VSYPESANLAIAGEKSQLHSLTPRPLLLGEFAELIHSQNFTGVIWMFSLQPSLQNCHVTSAI
jgi:hypothetical protein